MVAHACDPSPWEAVVGGLNVQGQPGLQREPLSQPSSRGNRVPAFPSQPTHHKHIFQQPSGAEFQAELFGGG